MSEETQIVELAANHEWRFEVAMKDTLLLKLVHGSAELFGTELALGQEYEFRGQKASIYSWYGCRLEYSGKVNEYTSEDSPLPVYANLHFALEGLRAKPLEESKPSASILMLGPSCSGKSTVSKLLVSYALKQGRIPLLINLDPKSAVFAPPGGLSASPITDILDIENGWGYTAINGPSPIRPKQPLTYYYGLESISNNELYYRHLMTKLATKTKSKLEKDPQMRSGGMIIDAPAELANAKEDYSLVSQVITDYNVNAVAVIGDERMFSDLSRRFKTKFPDVSIVKLARSGGAVNDEDHSFLRQVQHKAIQQYFYGISRQALSPFTLTAKAKDLTVYRVLETNSSGNLELTPGDSGDYIQDEEAKQQVFLTKVEASSILQNCVLAMINAAPNDAPEVIADSEVLGYVHIVEADDNKKNLRILMPLPGRLPNKPFILGDFRYHE